MVKQILIVCLLIGIGALLMYFLRRILKSKFVVSRLPPRFIPVIESGLRWAIVFAVLVISMRVLGVVMSTVIASVSAFALVTAVAFFAYWSVLSNGLCSILLLLFQPFRVGDRIEVRENENNVVANGTVSGVNLIYLSLLQFEEDGTQTHFRIPTNLLFQRTIRVWEGNETKSLGQAYAENNLKVDTEEQ